MRALPHLSPRLRPHKNPQDSVSVPSTTETAQERGKTPHRAGFHPTQWFHRTAHVLVTPARVSGNESRIICGPCVGKGRVGNLRCWLCLGKGWVRKGDWA